VDRPADADPERTIERVLPEAGDRDLLQPQLGDLEQAGDEVVRHRPDGPEPDQAHRDEVAVEWVKPDR